MNHRFQRREFLKSMATALPIFKAVGPDGLDFTLQNSPTPQKYLIETMPGGVALLDYNNDGLLDIFLVNGGHVSSATGEEFDRANPRYWNRLYRQNRDGSFTDATESAGLARAGDGNYGMGVAVGDYDNDGFADLFVTNYGRNILYHNNGDGTFSDVTRKAGVAGGGWSTSAGFFDFDNDGHLDLFVARYMDWDMVRSKACGGAWRTYCPPAEFPATTNLLYRNRGDGTFEDISEKSGIASLKGRALGVSFADYDSDGFTDVVVANDGMQQYLFRNNRNGTFTECGLDSGAALSADGKPISGMGTVFQDYDNDGLPDIIVTDLPRQTYGLYHNDGKALFSIRSLETGLGALTGGHSGWSVGLEDFDNDGWKDLLVAQSHVMDNVEAVDHSLHYLERPLLAMNRKGNFVLSESGAGMPVAGRGLAFGDLNNDGWQDAVMTVLGGPPVVLINRASGEGHWLSVRLRGKRSNRDGFGARVSINGQTRFATASGGYLSAHDKRLHFGLGNDTTAKIEIAWPSGRQQKLTDVRANQFIEITEPG